LFRLNWWRFVKCAHLAYALQQAAHSEHIAKEAVAQKRNAAYSLRCQNEKQQQENLRKYVSVVQILCCVFVHFLVVFVYQFVLSFS